MAPIPSAKALIDFHSRWDGLTTESLQRVPKNRRGLCGCDIACRGVADAEVLGKTYILHWLEILEARAKSTLSPKRKRPAPPSSTYSTPTKRQRTLEPSSLKRKRSSSKSPSPSSKRPRQDALSSSSRSPSPSFDHRQFSDEDVFAGDDLPVGDEDRTPRERTTSPLADVGDGLDEAEIAFERAYQAAGGELGRQAEDEAAPRRALYANAEFWEGGGALELQGDEDEACEPTIDFEALLASLPAFHPEIQPLSEDDIILDLPFLPNARTLLHDHSGNAPNPYADHIPSPPTSHNFLTILPPLLAFTLSSTWNVCRSAVELSLKAAGAMLQVARETEYERFTRWYRQTHPDASSADLAGLAQLDPKLSPTVAPLSLATSLKRLGINQSIVVHPVCSQEECCHVYTHIRSIADFHKLPIKCDGCKREVRDPYGTPRVVPFPVVDLWKELERALNVPGVEPALMGREAAQRERRRRDASHVGDQDYHQGPISHEQDDGSAWDERDVGNELHVAAGTAILHLLFSLDWANVSSRMGAASNSFGPMLMEFAGLLNRQRRIATTMVLGMTPGPKKPSSRVLHKLLVPLFMQIRDAETNGVWLQTPAFPKGGLFLVKLACIVADRPAAVDITGGPYYGRHDTACLRCWATHAEAAAMINCPHRDSLEHHRAILRQPDVVREALAKAENEHRAAKVAENLTRGKGRQLKVGPITIKRRNEIIKDVSEAAGNLSATMLLHRFAQFPSTPFDPMHSLLEGLIKTCFYLIGILGKHSFGGDTSRPKLIPAPLLLAFQQAFLSLVLPIHVTKLHSQFGLPSAIQPSADQWRSLASVYGPLLFPHILAPHLAKHPELQPQFDLIMRLFEIVTLALRSSISHAQIDHLESLIGPYLTDIFALFPSLIHTPNFHVLTHLPEDLRRYGPCYGWWSFRLERVNFIMKQIQVSGANVWQDVVVRLRAFMRKRQVEQAPERCLGPEQGDGGMVDKLRRAFAGVKQGLAIGATFAQTGGSSSTWQSSVPFEIEAAPSDTPLSTSQYRSLRRVLVADRIPHRTSDSLDSDSEHPYLVHHSRQYTQIKINGVRVAAADPGGVLPKTLSPAQVTDVVQNRQSLVELRTHADRFTADNRATQAYVLCSVFEHRHADAEAKLYMVLRPFVSAMRRDIWGYHKVPTLAVGIWEGATLGEAICVHISRRRGGDIGLLAAAPVQDTEGPVWLTIPLSRHEHL